MRYLVENSLHDFPAWSGAIDTMDTLKENGDVDAVEDYINEVADSQEEPLTETEINDILWHERDSIAEWLGYRNWDAYEYGEEEDEEQDEDYEENNDCEISSCIQAVADAVKKVEEILGRKIM